MKSSGIGLKPRNAMHAVSGRLRFFPSCAKDVSVSPRPWRRIRMLTGEPVEGGMNESVAEEEKSVGRGRRDIVWIGD